MNLWESASIINIQAGFGLPELIKGCENMSIDTEKQYEVSEESKEKPFYQQRWFIAVCIAFILGILIGFMVGRSVHTADKQVSADVSSSEVVSEVSSEVGSEVSSEEENPFQTIDQMLAEEKENSLRASEKYEDQYVEVTGKISSIDGDGDFLLEGSAFIYSYIWCEIQNEEQKQQIVDLSVGDIVTVKGVVTDILTGYWIDVDEIIQ